MPYNLDLIISAQQLKDIDLSLGQGHMAAGSGQAPNQMTLKTNSLSTLLPASVAEDL